MNIPQVISFLLLGVAAGLVVTNYLHLRRLKATMKAPTIKTEIAPGAPWRLRVMARLTRRVLRADALVIVSLNVEAKEGLTWISVPPGLGRVAAFTLRKIGDVIEHDGETPAPDASVVH